MSPTDKQVARLPRWAQAYIHGLESRIERSETPLKIEAGVVQGFVLTRAEVRCARMVAESQMRREVADIVRGRKP
jgi:hypothetical protein